LKNVLVFEEQGSNFWIFTCLTTEVETNDAAGVVLGGDARKQNVQPSERDALAPHGNAEKHIHFFSHSRPSFFDA
jgi:hypothetical protein